MSQEYCDVNDMHSNQARRFWVFGSFRMEVSELWRPVGIVPAGVCNLDLHPFDENMLQIVVDEPVAGHFAHAFGSEMLRI